MAVAVLGACIAGVFAGGVVDMRPEMGRDWNDIFGIWYKSRLSMAIVILL
jgi:hypothetical protein